MFENTNSPLKTKSVLVRKYALVGALALAGCGGYPGPSVPFQSGQNLAAARAAVQSCGQFGPRGERWALTGNYAAGVVLGGIVVGPIIVASNHGQIRANGGARAVDRCLAEQGFARRDLTPAEVNALNGLNRQQRERLLSHLVGGGDLASFAA